MVASLPRKVSSLWKVVIGIGLAILLHSAVSCVHFKHFTKSMGKEPYVPFDVKLEAVLGFIITLLGVLVLAGDFRPAKAAAAASAVSLSLNSSSPSFNIFNHRGRSLRNRLIEAKTD
jgi:membrane magnesium transporter 1